MDPEVNEEQISEVDEELEVEQLMEDYVAEQVEEEGNENVIEQEHEIEVGLGESKIAEQSVRKDSEAPESQDQKQEFIAEIKKTQDDKAKKKLGSDVIHMSHSSGGSIGGLSEAPEIINLEIREYEEDGIAPDDEDMVPKKQKVQDEHQEEDKKEEAKEDLGEEEEEEGAAAGPQEAFQDDEIVEEEEEEDIEDEKADETIIDLLYEIDEEFNPELEYVDTREGDEDWEEPVYDCEDFVSEPYLSENCTMDKNIIEFNYSLGYDSCRRYNLCVMDETTVIYLSGNYIHIYNTEKNTFQFIRSSSGVGLGHIAKHPFEPIFAVGERGEFPLIILYTYPDLKIIRVLKGGTDKFYNYIYFSPNGEWLLSQGGDPDNSLAIWNWKFERQVITQKCLGREVWRAETNPYIVGGITTSGVSHIRFWNMNETFTGLKLRGQSGKFGSNEFCDISTFCALPKNMVFNVKVEIGKRGGTRWWKDDKWYIGITVLSPNSSKNVYVWEGVEIRMELKRRNGLSLHENDITYLEFKQNYDEIFTVGLEGIYKVWDYTRIEYGKKMELYELELQPTYQRKLMDDMGLAHPMYFQKKSANDPNSEMYYMQDKRGSIWLVEMAVKEKLQPSKRVFLGHQSPIGDIAPSPADYYLASIGAEGKLHIYNMKRKKLIMIKYFPGLGGSSLLWLPLIADSTASVLLVGFTDGTLRVIVLSIRARELRMKEECTNYINVIQALKPHSNAVTTISFNPHRLKEQMVVTGSLDKRVFLYWIKPRKEYISLVPFAFVAVSDPVHYMTWNKKVEALLITSQIGTIEELYFPKDLPQPHQNTYQINLPKRISRFTSVKSEILRNIVIERNFQRKQRRKEKRERKKQAELDKGKRMMEVKNKIQKHQVKEELQSKVAAAEEDFDFRQIDQKDSDDSEDGKGNHPIRRIRTRFDDFSDQVMESDEEFLQFLDPVDPKVGQEKVTLSKTELHKKTSVVQKKSLEDKKKEVEVEEGQVEHPEELSEEEEEEEYIDLDDISGDDLQEDAYGEISEDEDLPPLYEPPEPSPLYFANYIDKDSVWVSVGGYDVGYIYEYKLGQNKPYRSTLLKYDTEVEINCSLKLFGGEFLILGLGNGCIKFIKTNPEDFTDFSDYWQFAMHDNLNGTLQKIYATYDMRFLYSVGYDSNVFFYKVNLPETKFPDKKNLPQLLPPPLKLKTDGYIAPETLSLEDAKLAELHEKRKQMGGSRKVILKKKIDELTQRFRILIELNHGLPETQRLPPEFFVINEEFERRFGKTITDRKSKMTRNLEIEYWKAKIMRDKIYNYYIKPVKTFKTYVFSVDLFCKVTTFYQQKLSLPFLEAEKEAESMMVEILRKGRDKFQKPLKVIKDHKFETKFKKSKLAVRPLIKGEEEIVELLEREQKSIFTRLSKRRQRRKLLQNILTLFLEEKQNKKIEFIEDLEAKQIDHNSMTYVLKTDPNFKLNSLKRISKEKKFFQLVATRRKIHDYITEFNSEVLRLRNMKSIAVAFYKSLIFDAIALNSEFKDVPMLPPPKRVVIFEPLEFPELTYMDDPPDFPHEENIMKRPYRDHLFCQLYEINKTFPIESDGRIEEKIMNKIQDSGDSDIRKSIIRKIKRKYGFHTLWEQELMEERKQFLISEYIKKSQILRDMIEEFDKELAKLYSKRVDYAIKIYYLKIFFCKYYEELQIIRSYQLVEKRITNKMEIFFVQKHIFILRINIRKIRINKCQEDIKVCTKNFDKITASFYNIITNLTAEQKRHLIRIFKKKWKPEKSDAGGDEEESSEEEDEEDEDEEEEEDIDLEDLMAANFAPMDENVRPEGMPKEVFDKTFISREERHAEEKKMYEKKLEIQHYKDQIDQLRKTLLTIQTLIALFQVKMSIVLEEKHKSLSSVRTVVVLDSSQMQHFDTETSAFPPVKETVLFPLYTLKTLRSRKRELMEDIVSVQLKKQETVKHVKRLDLDIRYLRKRLKNVKDQINKEKLQKFGIPINLGRLEESIQLKIIKDFKYDAFPFHLKFHVDIIRLQKELLNAQKTTGEQIKQNTYEQLKLGALMEQKRVYQDILMKVNTKKSVQYLSLEEIKKRIEELKAMLELQANMKKCYIDEINSIKYIRGSSEIEKQQVYLQEKVAEKIMELEEQDVLEDEYPDEEGEYVDATSSASSSSEIESDDSTSIKTDGKTSKHKKYVKKGEVTDSPIDLTTDEERHEKEYECSDNKNQDRKKIALNTVEEFLEDYTKDDKL